MVLLDVLSLNAFELREETATYGHLLLDGFWSPDDYYCFLNTFKYDREKVILDKYTIFDKSGKREVYNWLQYFSRESIEKELKAESLKIIEYYSNVAGAPYSNDSTEFAIVAKKL